ncbi:uncharacterized protein BJ171DRAFT_489899 [Polychytrium aggregatum]|uniref:uncharacterized protein n=1 Tax=Polychytrium aggregatum TaxID=110093 RepID=UPI0022FDDFEF|nr:uncharacterized protein BJ171DRAFT_489899 [Polychytrium aggregatum]KAI9208759.1 hypothetical protein BJ171DRAFT_489899 [Polychytrium aggregatum]
MHSLAATSLLAAALLAALPGTFAGVAPADHHANFADSSVAFQGSVVSTTPCESQMAVRLTGCHNAKVSVTCVYFDDNTPSSIKTGDVVDVLGLGYGATGACGPSLVEQGQSYVFGVNPLPSQSLAFILPNICQTPYKLSSGDAEGGAVVVDPSRLSSALLLVQDGAVTRKTPLLSSCGASLPDAEALDAE